MHLKWTDEVSNDLEQIESFISVNNSFSVAVDVVLRVIDTTELVLIEYPHSGRPGRAKATRELVIDDLPFIVIYRINFSDIQILRVLHEAQQWPVNAKK